MAASMEHVKKSGNWKPVDIDPKYFADAEFGNLVSFQTLTDYEIVKGPNGQVQIKCGSTETGTEKQKKKKNTDKKQKTNAGLPTKGKSESKQTVKNLQKGKSNKLRDPSEKLQTKVQTKSGAFTVYSAEADVVNVNSELERDSKQQQELSDAKQTKNDDRSAKKRKAKDRKTKQSGVSKKWKMENSILNKEAEKPTTTGKQSSEDMTAWKSLFVPDPVFKALREQGFTSPTSIQALALPSAIRDRMDIVGAAETGSGKTLAFGIPVLNQILQSAEHTQDTTEDAAALSDSDSENEEVLAENEDGIGCVNVVSDVKFDWLEKEGDAKPIAPTRKLMALILTPTRELAVQVKNHLEAAAKYTSIKIAVIVGGMAPQKQQRILKRQPEIVVATPGRLWELIQEGEPHLSTVADIKCLVIDEADRMVEKGHFQELSSLLELINTDENKKNRRQNFVFSATLTFVHLGPQRMMKKKKKYVKFDQKQKLESLMTQIGIKEKPKIIDLTRKVGTAETLSEAKINCSSEEKDLYLYYFLLRYPGRTLVFANSIDCIRRLISVFTVLEREPLALHANMHQKQRLKNLEKFTANEKGLLLATDVAARGLDIPDVQHVIHYQVPRTCENYIHRSGRTARAMKEGVSVVLVGQDDMRNYRKIVQTLNRDEDLPTFPVDEDLMPAVKTRVTLARKIDVEEHRASKKRHENDWFLKAAREMDVDIESDQHLLHDLGDTQEQSIHKQKLKQLRAQMKSLLKQSLASQRFAGKYPTKSGKLVVPSFTGARTDAITTLLSDRKSHDALQKKLKIRNKTVQRRLKKNKRPKK